MADFYNKMESDVTMVATYTSNQSGEVIISVPTTFPGEMTLIGNANRAKADVDIMPLPVFTTSIKSISDTYIRSSIPKYSYGKYESMYIGCLASNRNDIFKSFINFDLDTLPSNIYIKRAYIKLKCINSINTNVNIYSLDRIWQENNTTWNYHPNIDKLISTNTVQLNQEYLELDVTQYLKDYRNNLVNNYGFQLSIDSPLTNMGFFSKESQYSPELILDYCDASVNAEYIEFPGEVNIYISDKKVQNAEVNVYTEHTTDYDYCEGEITISRDTQPSEVTILCHSEQSGEINIFYDHQISEKESEVNIYRNEEIYQSSEINIITSKEDNNIYEAEITILRNGENNQSGEIITSISNNQSGEIITSIINNQSGEIDIITSKDEDITQQGETNIYRIDENIKSGEVNIYRTEEIYQSIEIDIITSKDGDITQQGEINIYRIDQNTKSGEIITSIVNNQSGEIITSISNNQSGEIFIYGEVNTNISSEIIIGKNNDYNGEVSIYRTENNIQQSEINIYRIDQNTKPGEVITSIGNNQSGEIITSITNNQSGEITIYRIGESYKSGEINIIDHINTNSIKQGQIGIYRREGLYKSGEVNIIDHINTNNIKQGQITIYKNAESILKGEFEVKQRFFDDCSGEIDIIITKTDNSLVSGEVSICANGYGFIM